VPSPQSSPPAAVRNGGIKEADLATITLTPQAEQRLGIQTVPVTVGRMARSRTLAGEVVVPPDRSQLVLSPVAGTLAAEGTLPPAGSFVSKGQMLFRVLPLVPAQRDLRVTAEAELAAASSRLEAARLRHARAERMLRDQVGSQRALEEAAGELKQAEAASEAARARVDQVLRAPLDADVSIPVAAPASGTLRQVLAAPGQKVAAGAPLFEISDYSTLWLRVPVYAGELPEVDPHAAAMVENIGAARGAPRPARPVAAPPTADPRALTVDLYYELPNGGGPLRPGQSLNASLPFRGAEEAPQVPRAAILYDFRGGAWVYEQIAPHAFTRQRVDIRRIQGETAYLERGPRPGTPVVTAGAAELFGTEFGAGK
jgi:RND family efflux transporter MFP subunit